MADISEFERGRLQGLLEAADVMMGSQFHHPGSRDKKLVADWNKWVCELAEGIESLRKWPTQFDYITNLVDQRAREAK